MENSESYYIVIDKNADSVGIRASSAEMKKWANAYEDEEDAPEGDQTQLVRRLGDYAASAVFASEVVTEE